jgi:hypothetical protein
LSWLGVVIDLLPAENGIRIVKPAGVVVAWFDRAMGDGHETCVSVHRIFLKLK